MRYILQDSMECPHAEGFMPGDSQVVNLSVFLHGESLVAAGLMRDTIAVP